jgi:hypothetical protein
VFQEFYATAARHPRDLAGRASLDRNRKGELWDGFGDGGHTGGGGGGEGRGIPNGSPLRINDILSSSSSPLDGESGARAALANNVLAIFSLTLKWLIVSRRQCRNPFRPRDSTFTPEIRSAPVARGVCTIRLRLSAIPGETRACPREYYRARGVNYRRRRRRYATAATRRGQGTEWGRDGIEMADVFARRIPRRYRAGCNGVTCH